MKTEAKRTLPRKEANAIVICFSLSSEAKKSKSRALFFFFFLSFPRQKIEEREGKDLKLKVREQGYYSQFVCLDVDSGGNWASCWAV